MTVSRIACESGMPFAVVEVRAEFNVLAIAGITSFVARRFANFGRR